MVESSTSIAESSQLQLGARFAQIDIYQPSHSIRSDLLPMELVIKPRTITI